jgi:RPA family protein
MSYIIRIEVVEVIEDGEVTLLQLDTNKDVQDPAVAINVAQKLYRKITETEYSTKNPFGEGAD